MESVALVAAADGARNGSRRIPGASAWRIYEITAQLAGNSLTTGFIYPKVVIFVEPGPVSRLDEAVRCRRPTGSVSPRRGMRSEWPRLPSLAVHHRQKDTPQGSQATLRPHSGR